MPDKTQTSATGGSTLASIQYPGQKLRRFENEKQKDPRLTINAFAQKCQPIYILVDIIQNLYDLLNEEKKVSQMEMLEELLSYGGYLVATSEVSMRGTRCSLFQKLSQVRSGLVVGNVKKQNVFPYTKFREENRDVEMGYYFGSDGGQKVKLIQYQ